MTTQVSLEVSEGKVTQAMVSFCRRLLENKLVDALLIPLELPSKQNAVPALVTDPDMLKAAAPLAPVLPVNSARIISDMTKIASSHRKVGVVLRSCELRSLVELVKLKQASLDNLLLIGVDCFGTFSIGDYGKFASEAASPGDEFLHLVKEGKGEHLLREACQVCEYPIPLTADLVVGLVGMDWDKEILIQASTPEGERILEALEMKDDVEVKGREEAISRLISERIKKRDELFDQTQKEVSGLDNLRATLSPCINCHNCRDVCALCYCKECIFDSPTFEWEADKYLGWAERKGALRMPTDTLLFHLTRLNHMVSSCVGCGLCSEACPNDVPVFKIFRLVGSKVQDVFDYVPGRSLEDELPLATFKEDELPWVGVK